MGVQEEEGAVCLRPEKIGAFLTAPVKDFERSFLPLVECGHEEVLYRPRTGLFGGCEAESPS